MDKNTKEQITALRGEVRRDVKGAKAKLHSKEGYVRNMQHYLKHGDWIDNFYGEYEEKKVQWVTILEDTMGSNVIVDVTAYQQVKSYKTLNHSRVVRLEKRLSQRRWI